MTSARVDIVPPDLVEAHLLLGQARKHQASASLTGLDNESAYILLYSAMHKAATAGLIAAGKRISSGAGAHAVLLQQVRRLLGQEHAELINRLDRARQRRNRVAYESEEIGRSQLNSLRAASGATIEVVQQYLDQQR